MAIAFDAVSEIMEQNGDGVLTLTHTAVAISDTAAFVGVGSFGSGVNPGGVTYTGATVAELWDFRHAGANLQNAGYSVVGITAGGKSVTSTLTDATLDHALGVITMTGVDQTTPTGTAATAEGSSTTGSATAPSPAADDMIVDHFYCNAGFGDPLMTAQTGRVERWDLSPAWIGTEARASTKPGSTGGANAWTGTTQQWAIGVVAFKATGAGPAEPRYILTGHVF